MARDRNKSGTQGVIVLSVIAFVTLASAALARSQQCVASNPTVIVSPDNQSAFAGNQLSYMVAVTNNDSAACCASSFVLMATFPEDGFKLIPDSPSVVLSPGETQSIPVIIKAPGRACVGPRVFRLTALNKAVPGASAFDDAVFDVISIVPDCGRAAPSVTVSPSMQQALSGEQLIFRVSVKNNDNPSCGAHRFIVTPSLPPGLSSQTPARIGLTIAPGESAFRDVIIRSDILSSGDLHFSENATHECASCLSGAGIGTFTATRVFATNVGFCCDGPAESTPDGGQRFTDCQLVDVDQRLREPISPCLFLINCPNGRSNGDGSITCYPGPVGLGNKVVVVLKKS